MDTIHEVNETTRDEYGLKAGGTLAALENFSTLFGLRLDHLLFAAAEETSKVFKQRMLARSSHLCYIDGIIF